MAAVIMRWRSIVYLLGSLLMLVVYNEWLVYYMVLLQCQWPQLDGSNEDFSILESSSEPSRVVLLADTHLLGTREGHWFDKLRREWQMERAFQASMLIHDPEAVFILGDLFDEGKWCTDAEFKYYLTRFQKMFQSTNENVHVVVGNHDIGFHYMTDEHRRSRFARAFSAPSVRMLTLKNNIFILMNSMAFEEDGCSMCLEAEDQLSKVVTKLACAQGKRKDDCKEVNMKYTKPILLQHFPLFRESDSNCSGPDAASGTEKEMRLRPRWDCLDRGVSKRLLESLQPRLVISAHTHNFCFTMHNNNTPEWTVPSFSWRYKNNPSFLLMVLSNNNYAITKCYLPQESTVVYTYITGCLFILVWVLFPRRLIFNQRIVKEQ